MQICQSEIYIFLTMAQQPLVGQGLLIIEDSWSHSDTLLWASDRPEAETSTSQQTTLARDEILWPGGIRTLYPSKRVAADPRLRQRGIIFSLDLENFTSIGFANYDASAQLISIEELR
jgi:hypothetical protein